MAPELICILERAGQVRKTDGKRTNLLFGFVLIIKASVPDAFTLLDSEQTSQPPGT